jgi:hypothetical protein
MKPRADSVHPPRVASWLLTLFVPAELAESIQGDLLEESSALASQSGLAVARSWYWRQTLRTIAHFSSAAIRAWSTLVVVLGGFLLLRFVSGLSEKFLALVTDKYLAYWSAHLHAYVWLLRGIPVAHVIGSLLVGCMVALAAKGREVVATIALALIPCVMIAFSLLWLARLWPFDETIVWLLWQYADPFAIVAGGVLVRKFRSALRTPLTSS